MLRTPATIPPFMILILSVPPSPRLGRRLWSLLCAHHTVLPAVWRPKLRSMCGPPKPLLDSAPSRPINAHTEILFKPILSPVFPVSLYEPRMTFGVDPDTHIDAVEQAKASTIEGTSKWSCKLSITGTHTIPKENRPQVPPP